MYNLAILYLVANIKYEFLRNRGPIGELTIIRGNGREVENHAGGYERRAYALSNALHYLEAYNKNCGMG